MKSRNRAVRQASGAIVALVIAFFSTNAARAADPDSGFGISPTLVTLTDAAPTTAITVTNNGPTPLRVQANGFVWQHALDGSMVLTPTDALLVYPVLLSLQPGEFRLLRVGTTLKSDVIERSYRVVISAIPIDQGAGQTKSIALRTRASVPVFLASAAQKLSGDIVDPVVGKSNIRFEVHNDGTTHFNVTKAHVTVLGPGGETLAAGDVAGWYVLPGERRPFVFAIPAGDCAKATAVSVDLTGPAFIPKKTFEHLSKQCGAG
jgi:P pilus assembly chaperone PapD